MAEQLRLWDVDNDTDPRHDGGRLEQSQHIPATSDPAPNTAAIHEPPPQLITSGVIAQETGGTRRAVLWILETRLDIQPAAYAGRTRLYRPIAIARVRHELNAIAAKRSELRGERE